MCVEINTTRAISAQIIRHRSFSFQEYSLRYALASDIGKAELPHLRRQDIKNRQNSIDDLSMESVQKYYRRISQLFEDSEHLYNEMVSDGVAKECARSILPLATPTRIYMNGTLRSWAHYLELRCDPATQREHREVAEKIKQIFEDKFPVISEAIF
jgi:thymidylate synthase (FAD)